MDFFGLGLEDGGSACEEEEEEDECDVGNDRILVLLLLPLPPPPPPPPLPTLRLLINGVASSDGGEGMRGLSRCTSPLCDFRMICFVPF